MDARLDQGERTMQALTGDTKEIKTLLSSMSTLLTTVSTRFQDRIDERKAIGVWQVALVSAGVAGTFTVLAQVIAHVLH